MSSIPSARKYLHLSPPREYTCDPAGLLLSQGGCLAHDHGQNLGPECGLMEISEAEYTHLQHFFQTHMEAHDAPQDATCPPATVLGEDPTESTISPLRASQAIDLSISTDEHCLVMPGEKTPVSYGEVPGYVLARIRGEDSPAEPCNNSSTTSQNRSRSAARVCLEKRFNIMSTHTPKQQHIKSAVLSNFLTIVQQSAEVQEAVLHPETHRWIKTDRPNPFEFSSQFVGDKLNPVLNTCEQVIGHTPHIDEPNRLNNAASSAPDSSGKSGNKNRKRAKSQMSYIQRRERHNSKERERRKRIRSYCDELNMLVPFCEVGTDKVSTLQWTTAFLRYINEKYGDILKEEFQKAYADGKGHFLKSSPSSGQDPIQGVRSNTLSTPLAVEQ